MVVIYKQEWRWLADLCVREKERYEQEMANKPECDLKRLAMMRVENMEELAEKCAEVYRSEYKRVRVN
jgi:hypothetical protein